MASLISLLGRAREAGLLQDDGLEQALLRTDPLRFVSGWSARFVETDVPLPVAVRGARGLCTLPPSTLCLLLGQAHVRPGAGPVLVLGADGGYLGYLLSEWLAPSPITVVDADSDLVELTRRTLVRTPPKGDMVVSCRDPMEGHAAHGPYQAIISTVALPAVPRALAAQLLPKGRLVAPVGIEGEQPLLAYEAPEDGVPPPAAPSGDLFDAAELRLFAATGTTHVVSFPPLQRQVEPDQPWRTDITLQDVLANAWQYRISDEHEGPFLSQARDGITIFERPHPELSQAGPTARKDAMRVMELAYLFQMTKQLRTAIDLYELSLSILPTAEAHTFLGWTYSHLGRFDRAIDECKTAITVDPALGNPYNDIGAYLIEQGQVEEAIPWLRKATSASRYDSPFFAHANLGRVHLMLGQVVEARAELLRALEQNPSYPLARALLKELDEAMAQQSDDDPGEMG